MVENKKSTYGNMVIDDGSEKVEITNLYGEVIGVFKFRPTDISIFERYNEVVKKFEDILSPLDNIGINSDGTGENGTDEEFKVLSDVKSNLFKELNYVFGGNMSDAFFGNMNPFSIVKGSFYCENAFETLGNFIAHAFDVETKMLNKKTTRYTHGYRTGKHKKGGKKGSR